MTEPTHSPLPWSVAIGHDARTQDRLIDANGDFIARIDGPNFLTDEANARLIVAAVNSHAALLAAAKGLLQFNEDLCADINISKHYPSAEKARAAISSAEEQAP